MNKVLVTCPPMLGQMEQFTEYARQKGIELVAANVTQVLSEEQLIDSLPRFDGWIIGDDPASRQVFTAAKAGKLRAAVKWGIGTDNVDFDVCQELSIPISNTPHMFGAEVADIAIGYIVGLARQTFYIDREVRAGKWPKPAGMSISGKKVGILGFGDIGKSLAKRLSGFDVEVIAFDPFADRNSEYTFVKFANFPERLDECDFLVLTCSLNESNHHIINQKTLIFMKLGSMIVNVARGPLIDELALIDSLESNHIAAAALDVFEYEPLGLDNRLRHMDQCIFGSHNSSNTVEAVKRASLIAIDKMEAFLNEV